MNVTTDCESYMQKVFFTNTENNTESLAPSNTTTNSSSSEVLKLTPEEQPEFLQKVCGFATQTILRSLHNVTVNTYDLGDNHVWSGNSTFGNCSSSG